MREMKDSGIEWVGTVPKNWELLRGRVIFSQRNSKGNTEEVLLSATQAQGMYPQYLLEGVVQTKEDTDLQTFKTVHKNDYVISLRSFQGGFEISEYEGVCSPAYQVFYSIKEIDHRYYKMLFKSDGFISKMNSLTVGIREGKNIQYKDFATTLIPYPSIDEQRAIANYLDTKCSKIDEIIAKQEQIIEKLKEYKLSVITEAVTKGLESDLGVKDSGDSEIGLIPKNSVVMKLKYLCNTQGRIGFKGYTTADLVDEGEGAITLGASHMNNGVIDLTNPVYISWEKYYESPEIMVNQGDILIVQRGSTIGKTAIVDKDYGKVTINPSLVLMNKIRINNKYLLYALSARYIVNQIELIGTNTAIPMISQKQINELKVVVPPKEEQDRIKEYLDSVCRDIDYKILKFETLILKLQAYKKSLIYEVVTGKKEV